MKSRELLREAAACTSKNMYVNKFFANELFDGFFARKEHELEYAGKDSLRFPVVETESPEEDEKDMQGVNKNKKKKFPGQAQCATLQNVFNIKLPEKSSPAKNVSLFKARFMQAVFGNGSELAEITQINSSALVALLCFYPLNELNPIVLSFRAKGTEHTCRFTDLVIEKENPVYVSPSSIDLALYGKDLHTGEAVTLFLESKFKEYFSTGDCSFGISYSGFMSRLISLKRSLGLLLGVEFAEPDKKCHINGKDHYCEGIKQMIAHYIGATNSYELNVEGRKVYLGTILFDFSELVPEARTALDDYKVCYKGLATLLNTVSAEDSSGVDVLDQAFTYQSLFGAPGNEFKLDEDVAAFYRLGSR